mgnify:FL=1
MKDFFKDMKSNLKTPRGKAIAYLTFYFIFFVVIIVMIRSNHSVETNEVVTPKFDFSLIESNNYHFHYQDVLGNGTTVYDGDRNQDNSLFTKSDSVNSLNVYSSGSIYLGRDNSGLYVMIDNPYLFPELKDLDSIKKILNKATYISTSNLRKTYQISTTTLVSIFDNQEIDLDDMPNTIVVTTNSDGQIYKLEYDFSSYSIYRGYGAYQGSLLYSNFSNIPEIEKPV